VKDSNGRTHVVHWKEQPYECFFVEFENSAFRQTFPVFRLDPEKVRSLLPLFLSDIISNIGLCDEHL
jgi:hypothetical protein